MWIKSQFKDYYDPCQRFTQGNQVWTRNHTFVSTNIDERVDWFLHKRFAIGYCGTIYYGVKDEKRDWKTKKDVVRYCYDVSDYCRSNDPNRGSWAKSYETKFGHLFKQVKDDEFFRKYNSPVIIGYFGTMRVNRSQQACIHWTCHTLGAHEPRLWREQKIDTLDSFDFQKIRAPELAYQEIIGYITGTLMVEHTSVPEQTNQDKIQQHGFDQESFRK